MIRDTADGILIAVKAVPGGSRDRVVGQLGDALKVKVAAPPEGGKANAAICQLLAKTLGVAKRDVTIESGPSQPNKQIAVTGIDAATALSRLGL
jgi:uncharacterized protein (TIGR00251 family)